MVIANWTLDQVFDQLHRGTRWDSNTISYAFPGDSGGIYSQGEATGFRATNASQQNLMLLALATWDDLIPQAFAAGAVGSTDLEFGYTNTNIGYAHAYYPAIGSIYFNTNHAELVNTYVGDYGFYTYLHEIGHSIGLRHMGDYNGNGNWSPSSFQDSIVLSVMSYFGPRYAAANYSAEVMLADWTDAGGRTWSPQTPMVNDALAIQAIYGTSATTRLEDTVYGFGSTVGGSLAPLYDFARNLNPILTIFDSGGVDTLDLSGWATVSRIDLQPGAYSSANSMTNNIAIAYTALIENAIGGGANDVLAGNDAGNRLEGRGGNDVLWGGGGDDVLIGGPGDDTLDGGEGNNDTAVFEGVFAAYTITVGVGVVMVSGGASGSDRVSGVERFVFADVVRTIAELSPGTDTSAPQLLTLLPAHDAEGVPVGASLVLGFNEAVEPGNGSVSIYNADGSLFVGIAAGDGTQMRFAGSSLTIDPALDLVAGQSYYVTLSHGAVTDRAGNAYAGFGGATAWHFVAVAGDAVAPVITALSPADDAGNIAVGADFVIAFNEPVLAGSGNITIRDGNTVLRSIAAGDTSQVAVLGGTVTVDPAADLPAGGHFSITIDAGAFRDGAGNGHAGLLSTSAWNFGTRSGTALDDYPYDLGTPGLVVVNANAVDGVIETASDADLFRVQLTAGVTYSFTLERTAGGLQDPVLVLYDPAITQVGLDDDGAGGGNSRISYTAATTGTHYLGAYDYGTGTGAYTLQASTLDRQAPTLDTRTPADDGTQVDGAADLVLAFSEAVFAGSGSVRIFDSNGLLVREIRAADAGMVSVNGASVTIDPGAHLPAGSRLHVNIDAAAFVDAAGNAYAGLFGSTAWNFDTRAVTASDDYPLSVDTPGLLVVGGAGTVARIDSPNDGDLFRVDLVAGVTYQFDMVAPQTSALDPFLALYGRMPEVERVADDDDSGPLPLDARLYYTVFESGTYYLAAFDYAEETGSYTLSVTVPADDYLASVASTGRVSVGAAAVSGVIDVISDTDLFGIDFVAGRQYTIDLRSQGLDDPYLVLLGADGVLLASDDDTGGELDSQITFTAASSGLHWVAASDYDVGSGRYTVSAFERHLVNGSAAADILVGGAGPDTLVGLSAADRLRGAQGDDILDGGAGVDVAVYVGPAGAFTLGRMEAGWVLHDTQGSEGRDLLYGVERIEFADLKWALDLDGNAGTTVKIIGAVFGPDAVDNAQYVGIGLALLDAGMSYLDLMQLALDARLGTHASNADLVNLLYGNVVGMLPDLPTRLYYEGLVSGGQFSPAGLGVMAAETELNKVNVDLVGLADLGIGYS
ncbi:MAG: Ig-like domain-containing protein [Rubrivivax sp.]|nr:Ig-like domain-containing protein [Rubrivivax sp.]